MNGIIIKGNTVINHGGICPNGYVLLLCFLKKYFQKKTYKNVNLVLTNLSIYYILSLAQDNCTNKCASGSVVEYRLAKARVAGSNPVSRLTKTITNPCNLRVSDFLLLKNMKAVATYLISMAYL